MKNKIKGKMVKTDRPKVNVSDVNCECMSCGWQGDIEQTKSNAYGDVLCPKCRDVVVIYED